MPADVSKTNACVESNKVHNVRLVLTLELGRAYVS